MGSTRVPPTLRSAIATARLMVAGNNPTPPNLKAPIERPGFGIQVAIGRSTIAPALFNFRIIPHPIFFSSRAADIQEPSGLAAGRPECVGTPRRPSHTRRQSSRLRGPACRSGNGSEADGACSGGVCGMRWALWRLSSAATFLPWALSSAASSAGSRGIIRAACCAGGKVMPRSTFRGFCGSRRGGGRLTAGR